MNSAVFYIVVSFWLPDGTLARQVSGEIPTHAECIRFLPRDVEALRRIHGNAVGDCLSTPPKPAGLPEVRVPIKKSV